LLFTSSSGLGSDNSTKTPTKLKLNDESRLIFVSSELLLLLTDQLEGNKEADSFMSL